MLIYLSASAHETILAALSVACLVGKTGEATMGPKSLKTEVPKKFKIVILGPTVKTEVATYYFWGNMGT